MEQAPDENAPRRSLRSALAPLTNTTLQALNNTFEGRRTPSLSPDEFIIEQRGRRRQPLTWSPVDYHRTDILGPPRDKTPDRVPQRAEISSKLRRRLVMSPVEEPAGPQLGDAIAKKLKALSDDAKVKVQKFRLLKPSET